MAFNSTRLGEEEVADHRNIVGHVGDFVKVPPFAEDMDISIIGFPCQRTMAPNLL